TSRPNSWRGRGTRPPAPGGQGGGGGRQARVWQRGGGVVGRGKPAPGGAGRGGGVAGPPRPPPRGGGGRPGGGELGGVLPSGARRLLGHRAPPWLMPQPTHLPPSTSSQVCRRSFFTRKWRPP